MSLSNNSSNLNSIYATITGVSNLGSAYSTITSTSGLVTSIKLQLVVYLIIYL
jgi:lipoprotein signal peptidase